MSTTPPFPVSVIILTKDEEINITSCLDHLAFSDDIVVYDSLSTDKTTQLAQSHPKVGPSVRIVSRKFDNWSAHQNWAVQNIAFKHPWVLYVDADEHVTPELAAELQRLADPASAVSAYRLRRKDHLMGRWLRHAQLYPSWFVRFFRPAKIKWERLVNPVAVVDGPLDQLEGHLMHYPFSKGITQWLERHNSYSSFEAQELLKVLGGTKREPLSGLFSGDPTVRRAVLKNIFFRLPLRPQVKWIYYVFWRMAWLDGAPGMTYARLTYLYEYMISIKAKELLASRDKKP